MSTREQINLLRAAIFVAGCTIVPFLAWITHIISTIHNEQWLLLIGGALAFPIGILHGTGIWFGVF